MKGELRGGAGCDAHLFREGAVIELRAQSALCKEAAVQRVHARGGPSQPQEADGCHTPPTGLDPNADQRDLLDFAVPAALAPPAPMHGTREIQRATSHGTIG